MKLTAADTVPEFDTLSIIRNGEEIDLKCYVFNKRCPGRIKAQVKQCYQKYEQTATKDGKFTGDETAFSEYLRETLLLIVIGLETLEADVIAGDIDKAVSILEMLNVLGKTNTENNDDTEGEVQGKE